MTIDIMAQKNLRDCNFRSTAFAAGELITLHHDTLWLLQQGVVKTSTWTEEGIPITLGYWGTNDLVGQSLSFIYPYHVRCLSAVQALCISYERSPAIHKLIQHQVGQNEKLLYILRLDNIYQRLKGILRWLGRKFGEDIEIGRVIILRLTHQDLAELVGATRCTVTKLVNQLEREGFISRPSRNTFVVIDRENLASTADS